MLVLDTVHENSMVLPAFLRARLHIYFVKKLALQ